MRGLGDAVILPVVSAWFSLHQSPLHGALLTAKASSAAPPRGPVWKSLTQTEYSVLTKLWREKWSKKEKHKHCGAAGVCARRSILTSSNCSGASPCETDC